MVNHSLDLLLSKIRAINETTKLFHLFFGGLTPCFDKLFLPSTGYSDLLFRSESLYFLVCHLVVGEVARQVLVVRAHIYQPVPRKVKQDGTRGSFFFGSCRFADGRGNGVRGLGRGDNTLGTRKEHARFKRLQLFHAYRFNQLVFQELAHDASGTMIAEPSRVDVRRGELVAQRVHGNQRGVPGLVAEIVFELTTRQLGTRGRFHGYKPGVFVSRHVMAEEGEGDAREVRTAPEATDHHVGIIVRHLHLFLGFQPDDGLVKRHVVEHASQGVFTLGCLHRQLDRFGDGSAQAPLVIGVVGNDLAACLGGHAGGRDHLCTPGLHQRATVGLLLVADLYHVNSKFQPERFRGKCQRRTPLSRPCLGGEVGGAFYFVVVSLGQCRVELMRPYRAHALVLEVDARGCIERLLQFGSPYQRGGTVYLVLFPYLLGNINPHVGLVYFLARQFFREKRVKIFRFQRLFGPRVDHGERLVLHLGRDVVPPRGDLRLGEHEFLSFFHRSILLKLII